VAMAIVERRCPVLLCPLDSESTPKMGDLSTSLEKGSEEEKVGALKAIIHCMISGIDMSRLTMQIIKFCLNSKSHEIKKLLQIYWEVLDKKDVASGKLKPEMILVCNHLLNDLKHANEYIRGSSLRLLCRIDEPEILEQLIPQTLQNLEHRHSYVRKNAVLAIMSIVAQHPSLIPDASARVLDFLETESNNSCKRNAFLMLTASDLKSSLKFFLATQSKIESFPEPMQITMLELMRKVCRTLPVPKSIFVQCAAKLLDSPSNSVVYEAANTLLSLTPLDSAVNKALEAYTRLLQCESDQNVKLIVINRLHSLRVRYQRNLRLVIMDILRGLSTPNIDVRRNILSLILALAAPNNIADIIGCLRKEIIAVNQGIALMVESDVASSLHRIEYRNLLVETIHRCAVQFPQVASSVVHLLMDYLGDESDHSVLLSSKMKAMSTRHAMAIITDSAEDGGEAADHDDDGEDERAAADHAEEHSNKNKVHHSAAYDVIQFVKEIVCEYPDLNESILQKLLESFNEIRSESVYRVALWILGEYSQSKGVVVSAIDRICEAIGQLPLCDGSNTAANGTGHSDAASAMGGGAGAAADGNDDDEKKSPHHAPQSNQYLTRTVVLPDGTYAQSTMAMTAKMEEEMEENDNSEHQKVNRGHHLRRLIKGGEYFLAAVLSQTLLKLMVRFKSFGNGPESNKLTAKCMLIITSIIRYGTLPTTKNQMDSDTKDRMRYALQRLYLGDTNKVEEAVLLRDCRNNFGRMLSEKRRESEAKKKEQEKREKKEQDTVPWDKMVAIRQLKGLQFSEFDEDDALNVQKAVGNRVVSGDSLSTRLSRIHQLTGFSDPIYAEAAVTVHQFDIVLDFLIINNTERTLQNLNLELHTSGDLKIVEKPNTMTLAPRQSTRIEASIKVSSTENGVIFGNIVYDTTGATADRNIVVMACIHMDIMDYVRPEGCSQAQFREMWVEFEWENKVPVNTDITDLNAYIDHVAAITNMQLLTPCARRREQSVCQFLAANLHAKSIFGEHALMNVSIELKRDLDDPEQPEKMKIAGHIRIRCKSQGIALSLGEKITNGQRSNP